jgi:hypothetical protein
MRAKARSGRKTDLMCPLRTSFKEATSRVHRQKLEKLPIRNSAKRRYRPITADVAVRMDAFRPVYLADVSTGHRLRGVVDVLIPVMVASMSTHGVIQPRVVRSDLSNPGKFLLVAGLQRVNAARASGADKRRQADRWLVPDRRRRA